MASDSIWREVQQIRQSGKPIIVSMGTYAASGGYYISGTSPVLLTALHFKAGVLMCARLLLCMHPHNFSI